MGGNNGSRILQIPNLQQHFDIMEGLGETDSPIYGFIKKVFYKDMEFYLAQSRTQQAPHPQSIHYLVKPEFLIFPQFTLLEDIQLNSLDDLLIIIQAISQMGISSEQAGRHLGVGYNRIGHNGKWGVVGQLEDDWTFQQLQQYRQSYSPQYIEGVFFSPQQMISLSRPTMNYDGEKADVFALGIMLVEKIFGQSLDVMYDYENFEIRLNPLLEKINRIKQNFGEDVASIFVGMLQIQEEDRYDFAELFQAVSSLIDPHPHHPSKPSMHMLNSKESQRNIQLSRGNRSYNHRTPKNAERVTYRNDVSPFRGRFQGTGVVKNNMGGASRRTPDRSQQSRSPMRRQQQKPRQDFQSLNQRVSPLSRR